MKKLLSLLFISITFANYGQTNQILDFKPHYAPEMVYNQTVTNSSDYEITYSGSEKFLEALAKNGAENPTKIKSIFTVETASKTGKLNKNGNFPITIEYTKSVDANGKNIIPNGTILYGNTSLEGLPKMDSIVSEGSDENFKNTIFQTVQSTFNQLLLPEKKLKIGESFSQENPLTIPIAGINIEMIITTTYSLKSITPKNAYFDITQNYTMKILDDRFATAGSGTGSGKLIYDIPNQFAIENQLNMEMSLNLKHTDFELILKSKSSFSQLCKISKK